MSGFNPHFFLSWLHVYGNPGGLSFVDANKMSEGQDLTVNEAPTSNGGKVRDLFN